MGNVSVSSHPFILIEDEKQNAQTKILRMRNLIENNWHLQILKILLCLVNQLKTFKSTRKIFEWIMMGLIFYNTLLTKLIRFFI